MKIHPLLPLLFLACSGTHEPAPSEPSPPGMETASISFETVESVPLAQEALRELANMRSSTYSSTTFVDEGAGHYAYDCSGFLSYAMRRVAPESLKEVAFARGKRPLAEDFVAHFQGLGPEGTAYWAPAPAPADLTPGDVVAWLRPGGAVPGSTGHVMVVVGPVWINPQRADELLVTVADSARSGHAADTRASGQTGLGRGVVGLLLDGANGYAVGYRWKGGSPRSAEVRTTLAFGRIRQ